jgi:hypothetical protein
MAHGPSPCFLERTLGSGSSPLTMAACCKATAGQKQLFDLARNVAGATHGMARVCMLVGIGSALSHRFQRPNPFGVLFALNPNGWNDIVESRNFVASSVERSLTRSWRFFYILFFSLDDGEWGCRDWRVAVDPVCGYCTIVCVVDSGMWSSSSISRVSRVEAVPYWNGTSPARYTSLTRVTSRAPRSR